MRRTTETQELQVMDYMTMSIVELVQQPTFDEEMFLACAKLARTNRYEFDRHQSVVESIGKLSYKQREALRDFYSQNYEGHLDI